MDTRQRTALIMPLLIIPSMIVVFQTAYRCTDDRQLAWYIGFLFYWAVWGMAYPLLLLGRTRVCSLFENKRPKGWGWLGLVLPPLLVLAGTMVIRYDPADTITKLILVGTSFITGTLEEILWRGIFVSLFPKQPGKGFIYPAICFALWHIAPGTVSNVPMPSLVLGALVLGLCWGPIVYRTGKVRWTAASHILTGIMRSIV